MQCVKDYEDAKEFYKQFTEHSLRLSTWCNGDKVGINLSLDGLDRIYRQHGLVFTEALNNNRETLTTILEAIAYKAVGDLVDQKQAAATQALKDKCEEISSAD